MSDKCDLSDVFAKIEEAARDPQGFYLLLGCVGSGAIAMVSQPDGPFVKVIDLFAKMTLTLDSQMTDILALAPDDLRERLWRHYQEDLERFGLPKARYPEGTRMIIQDLRVPPAPSEGGRKAEKKP